MNANELADELDGFLKEQEQQPWGTKQVYLDQAATMLRQQQAEIAELKVMLGHYEDVYEGVVTHPVQKPMMVLDGNCVYPAIKELTDEEIWGFMDEIEALVHGDIKRAMYRMARKVESILNE